MKNNFFQISTGVNILYTTGCKIFYKGNMRLKSTKMIPKIDAWWENSFLCVLTRGLSLQPNVQKGGLDRISIFKGGVGGGVLGKRGWLFSGGLQFLHKSKLKSGPYYQKRVNQMSLNFEFHNSLMLSFTDNGGLHSNFVYCESFIKSNSLDILVPCKDKPGWLNWFWQFLCERLSSFNPKGF